MEAGPRELGGVEGDEVHLRLEPDLQLLAAGALLLQPAVDT